LPYIFLTLSPDSRNPLTAAWDFSRALCPEGFEDFVYHYLDYTKNIFIKNPHRRRRRKRIEYRIFSLFSPTA
jgi:hypothetical protein